MWFLLFAAAFATELVAEWDIHGTAISPQTPLDAALIAPGPLANRTSFLTRASEPIAVGDAVLQLFSVVQSGEHVQITSLIAERDRMRSHMPLFEGNNTLLDAIALPGGLIQLTWGSDAAAYVTVVGFGDDGVIQKVAEDIPLRIGLSELKLAYPVPGRLIIAGRGLTPIQKKWVGRHTLRIHPVREQWTPRSGRIPVGDPAPAPPVYDSAGELRVNNYALQWGHHGDAGPSHDAVWVDTPQGTVALLAIPNQNGHPTRLKLRAFRRLHGHVYWAEIELVVAGVTSDTTYCLGWSLKLRRDEVRIIADQIPVREGAADGTRLIIDVPIPNVLVVKPATEQLSYWQRKWLGTWPLD
jgi:hypothetical protein